MKRHQIRKNISTGQMPPPMGYRTSPMQPQIVPTTSSGSSNVSSLRPTFAFLPYNADEVNKRVYAAKAAWKAKNPTKDEDEFPGMKDLYGTGNIIGPGSKFIERQSIAKSCANGQIYVESNNQCECPQYTQWSTAQGKCVTAGSDNPKCYGTSC